MTINFSQKGLDLIELYTQMAAVGYETSQGQHIENAFSDFELRHYRLQLKSILSFFETKTVLDYGSGGSDWHLAGFDEGGQSAQAYFGLELVKRYDPARGLDERSKVDAVICFDVLEHIHILDVATVLDPDVFVYLMCSTGWRNTTAFSVWSSQEWREQQGFEVKDGFY